MDINNFISGVTQNINNKTAPNTISTSVVGNSLISLAELTKTEVEKVDANLVEFLEEVSILKSDSIKNKPYIVRDFHLVASLARALSATGTAIASGGSGSPISIFYPVEEGDVFKVRNFIVTGNQVRCAIAFYSTEDETTFTGGLVVNGAATITESDFIEPPAGSKFYRVGWTIYGDPNMQHSVLVYNNAKSIKGIKDDSIQNRDGLSGNERGQFIPVMSPTGNSYINVQGALGGANNQYRVSEPLQISENNYLRVFNTPAYPSGQYGYAVAFYGNNDVLLGGFKSFPTDGLISDTGFIYPPKGVVSYRVACNVFGFPNLYSESTRVYMYEIGEAKKEKDVNIAYLEKVFNPRTEIGSSGVNVTGGLVNQNQLRQTIDFQLIPDKARFRLENIVALPSGSSNFATLAFYDLNKTFLASYVIPVGSSVADTGIIDPPKGAIYYKYSYVINTEPKLYIYQTRWSVEQLAKELRDESKPFVFNGDSISQGFANAMSGVLVALGYNTYHRTVGGESTLDTLARMGVYPYVAQPFTMPAGTTEVDITNNFSSRYGWTYTFDANANVTQIGSKGINPADGYQFSCIANGIKGNLRFTGQGGAVRGVYFKRDVAGDPVTFTNPVEFYPQSPSYITKDATYINFMGTNGGWTFEKDVPGGTPATMQDLENLVNYYKLIAKHIAPNDYIFLGFYETISVTRLGIEGYKNWMSTFERRMHEEFGYRYINIRKYLMSDVKKDLGIEWTAGDIDAIVNYGRIPLSVRSAPTLDQVHLSEQASRAVANLIFEKLHNLGKVKEHIKIPVYPV